ncbi:MAG: class B sortase [Solobacterium sp.]|nr:class B sortase [Solobacterium sp.]
MKQNKQNKWIWITLAILAVVVIAAAAVFLLKKPKTETPDTDSVPSAEPTAEPIPEETPEPLAEYELSEEKLNELHQELVEDQAINGDVKAILHFNTGLVHDPVLQTTTEDYYLYRDWRTHLDLSYGSIVLDSRNDLSKDEQNTIIYGHYIYEYRNPDRTLVFTPLSTMVDQSVYEKNRYVSLILNDEVRYYEVTNVFEAPLEEIDGIQYTMYGLEYNLLEYDPDYMSLYRENINRYEYFDSGIEIEDDDRLLTLQTCIENQHESREIVLCRELERKPLSGKEEE